MKILFAGGGSGGHFYPIIAIAEEINRIKEEEKYLDVEMYYMAPSPYNEGLLFNNSIKYIYNSAGKLRRYFSILNLIDLFKTGFGVISAIWKVFTLYPDVVVGKGGFGSFPTLLAARILRIPVVIHESDTVPGKVNKWAGKFAKAIALSYESASSYFPKKQQKNIALVGNPIRRELINPLDRGAHEFLKLEENVPVVFVMGGSQGARIINTAVIDALPRLLEKYQVIHQVGDKNLEEVQETTQVVLEDNPNSSRYKLFGYLNILAMRMSAGVSDIIISRAGSAIFEIASWGVPSIIIPITHSNGDHQRKNAFNYARSGAAVVVDEKNLSSNILVSEIDRIMSKESTKKAMQASAKTFSKPEASSKIAQKIMSIAVSHEI